MNRRDFLKSLCGLGIIPLSIEQAEIKKEEGQTIILQVKDHLSESAYNHAQKFAKNAFPNKKIVILDAGIKMRVIK